MLMNRATYDIYLKLILTYVVDLVGVGISILMISFFPPNLNKIFKFEDETS